MTLARMMLLQLKYENRAFWRNPANAFFTFAFPLMFLVIFNLLFGNDEVGPRGQEVSGSTFYVPAIAAFAVINACFTTTAISVTFLRDEGILKRVRGTPLPPIAYLVARVIHAVFVSVGMVAIVSVAGILLYDVSFPTDDILLVATIVALGGLAFSALGLAATAIVPNADAAPAVVNGLILPLLFISDIFIPLEANAPEWLVSVAKAFPIWHYAHAMLATFEPPGFEGTFQPGNLLVVAAWGVGGLALATKFFAWEPRK
jgi:ABC-2 type transport system permease protein